MQYATVILESPYAGNIPANVAYAQEAMRRCLSWGWAPLSSHLLYTQCLDDLDPAERAAGIAAGFAWRPKADFTVFFCRLGWSKGMILGREDCRTRRLPFITVDEVP